jgi:ribosomal protein S18 acetylase RimI-like enzyme
MIEIKKLPGERWKECRDLRLEALKNEPFAFASSYEEEIKLSESEWIKRLNNTLFAVLNDMPIGMIVYTINEKIKINHIANIYGIFVKNEYRYQGVGRMLIETALKIIHKNENVSKVRLSVNPDKKVAIKLYEKYGFHIIGRLCKELKIDDKYYDELIMEKFF